MKQTDLTGYKNIYLQTAKEYLEKMSVSLNQLSNDVSSREALNNLHIASHSLKSQSQMMGFMEITVLSGAIEKKSMNIQIGNAQVDDKFIIFLKDSIDKLKLELSKIEKRDAEINSA
jgi:chemotaxis protein histidine kinase CheA